MFSHAKNFLVPPTHKMFKSKQETKIWCRKRNGINVSMCRTKIDLTRIKARELNSISSYPRSQNIPITELTISKLPRIYLVSGNGQDL